MTKKIFSITSLATLTILVGCGFSTTSYDYDTLRVAHKGGFLSAVLYRTIENDFEIDLYNLRYSSDIAFALMNGNIDAGFLDAEGIVEFSRIANLDDLTVVGKITHPFGSTVVLREGLFRRLGELGGHTIAAVGPGCALLSDFMSDAYRLGVDLSDVQFIFMPEYAMMPALEAAVVDGAVISGTNAILALQEGHSILYQNWDMTATDECCPLIVAQAALLLVARTDRLEQVTPFVNAMFDTNRFSSPDALRQAVADNTLIPFEIMQGQPVPSFAIANNGLLEAFIHAYEHRNSISGQS